MAESLSLALSLDVEEEGLFCGQYQCINPSIKNTGQLIRLAPFLERGIRPTLFCAHSAFSDAESRKMLEKLRDAHGAEIGAHLHFWNTPPLLKNTPQTLDRVPAAEQELSLLEAKMASLMAIARDFNSAPVSSFRMGRWDLHAKHWPLLARMGIKCDASVRPLHLGANKSAGPDHFAAPADPYWAGEILEAPLTVTPLAPICARLPKALKPGLKKWGALALLPVQHPLWLMKLTTRLHVARGGRFLSLTWHSSEMMAKAVPHMPTREHVDIFLNKTLAYIDWLESEFNMTYVSMSDLLATGQNFPRINNITGDWCGTVQ